MTRLPLAAYAAAVPAIVATALLAAFVLAEASTGRTPLAYDTPRNIAEAAAMGRAADVVRFARGGADVGAIYHVRPEIISSSITRVTAAEGAIWSRRIQVVRVLDGEQRLPDDERRRLACLAADLGTDDIREYLAPGGATCEPGQTARAIGQRS